MLRQTVMAHQLPDGTSFYTWDRLRRRCHPYGGMDITVEGDFTIDRSFRLRAAMTRPQGYSQSHWRKLLKQNPPRTIDIFITS